MIPKTRQIIVSFIGLIEIGIIFGWAFGKIPTQDAVTIIMVGITGFFTLLKGEQ